MNLSCVSHDRPVENWFRHARQRRRLWLCKIRAFISFAGTRDRIMLLHLKRGSEILDVGCGGGRPVLTAIGRVTGLEPIATLAAQARQIYPNVVESVAEQMPFPDGQFDAVVSTDILGHIPVPIKDAVMSEMFRVLKPGGVTLHLAEADSDGWMARIAKREPEPYRNVWIEEPDHRAMEPARVQLERFRRAGFVVEMARPYMPILPTFGALHFLFKEHKHLPAWLKMACFFDGLVAGNETRCELLNIGLTPLAFVNLFAPVEAGMGLIIKARKPLSAAAPAGNHLN